MATELSGESRVGLLLDQLAEARARVEEYEDARLRLMNRGGLLMLGLLLLAYTKWLTMSALVLPFVVIYLVVQFGYLTHCLACSRAVAEELEGRIRDEAGEAVLPAAVIEQKRVGPLGESHFLGLSSRNLTGMFGATTLHFLILCFLVFLGGYLRSRFVLSVPELRPVERLADVYGPLLVLWTVVNVGYLIWFFSVGGKEKLILAAIRKDLKRRAQ